MRDVGNTPQLEAPILAKLVTQMHARPTPFARDPLPVDHDTYQKAYAEMKDVQERQGRAVMAAAWADKPNFLLMGVPVVCND